MKLDLFTRTAPKKAKGVKFKGDIVDDQALKVQYLEDPDGNELYLAEVKQQYTNY